jgi:dnd system-associated protein 4
MKKASRFSVERSIYWPAEYFDIVNVLTGKLADGTSAPGTALYQFNTGAIVFAAAVGLANGRHRAVGSERKEITTSTFAGHQLAGQQLDTYIFLIALLSKKNVDAGLLRVENEDTVLRIFEQYAAGGLEILRGIFDESPTQSVDIVIQRYLSTPQGSNTKRVPINLNFSA